MRVSQQYRAIESTHIDHHAEIKIFTSSSVIHQEKTALTYIQKSIHRDPHQWTTNVTRRISCQCNISLYRVQRNK